MKHADLIVPSNNENSGESNLMFYVCYLQLSSCKGIYCLEFKVKIEVDLWN
jgi:hypothetical protein